jgi:hypothetical protein
LNGNQSKINFKKYEAPKTFLDKLKTWRKIKCHD